MKMSYSLKAFNGLYEYFHTIYVAFKISPARDPHYFVSIKYLKPQIEQSISVFVLPSCSGNGLAFLGKIAFEKANKFFCPSRLSWDNPKHVYI